MLVEKIGESFTTGLTVVFIGILAGILMLAGCVALGSPVRLIAIASTAAFLGAAAVSLVGFFAVWLIKKRINGTEEGFAAWFIKDRKPSEKNWDDRIHHIFGVALEVVTNAIFVGIMAGLLSLAAWPIFDLTAHDVPKVVAAAFLGGAIVTCLVALAAWPFVKREDSEKGDRSWFSAIFYKAMYAIFGVSIIAFIVGIAAGLLSFAAWPIFDLIAHEALKIAAAVFLGGVIMTCLVAFAAWLFREREDSEKDWFNTFSDRAVNAVFVVGFMAIVVGILAGLLSFAAWPIFDLTARDALKIAAAAFLGGAIATCLVFFVVWLLGEREDSEKDWFNTFSDRAVNAVFGVGTFALIVGVAAGLLSLVAWPIFSLTVRDALRVAAATFLAGFVAFIGITFAVWLSKRKNGAGEGYAEWLLK